MTFWAEPFGNIVKQVTSFFYESEDDPLATEQTTLPKNIDPMSFDITAKTPLVEIIPDELLQPAPVEDIISQLLNSLSTIPEDIPTASENTVTPSSTSMDFSDTTGHTLVKITEYIPSGKTIEVVQESTTVLPSTISSGDQSTTIGDIANAITDNLNNLSSPDVVAKTKNSDPVSANVYVMAALVLLVLIALSIGAIFWFRRYKLKAVKKNGDYPVATQHLNNQMLTNTEKLKNIP